MVMLNVDGVGDNDENIFLIFDNDSIDYVDDD